MNDHDKLKILSELQPGDKLSISSGVFSIRKPGYISSLARTWYRENHSDDYAIICDLLERARFTEPEMLEDVSAGLRNYAQTYQNMPEHYQRLNDLAISLSNRIRMTQDDVHAEAKSPRSNTEADSALPKIHVVVSDEESTPPQRDEESFQRSSDEVSSSSTTGFVNSEVHISIPDLEPIANSDSPLRSSPRLSDSPLRSSPRLSHDAGSLYDDFQMPSPIHMCRHTCNSIAQRFRAWRARRFTRNNGVDRTLLESLMNNDERTNRSGFRVIRNAMCCYLQDDRL